MVVSQFTLYGVLKGNKPDFHLALNPTDAIKLYEQFIADLRKMYKPERIQTGRFGEYMNVDFINDGPVTLIIESEPETEKEGKEGKDGGKKEKKQKETKETKDMKDFKQNKEGEK